MGTDAILLVVAIGFALITGINDGGALLAPGLRLPGSSVLPSLAVLVVATASAPLLLGTRVAKTMLEGIVVADGVLVVATGFCVAIAVVVGLSRAGLPTSLTLAVVGGITGAGMGVGAAVEWETLARILCLGLLAPVAGAAFAYAGSSIVRRVRTRSYRQTVRIWHRIAFLALCVAYGANDGQKILVMFMLAAGARGGDLPVGAVLVAAAAFAVGAVVGLPRVARTIGTGILDASPVQVVTAESAAAVAVLGSAVAGSPVSMTQAVTGALVGAGAYDGVRTIRWQMANRIALAWAATLPVAVLLGTVVSLVVVALPGLTPA